MHFRPIATELLEQRRLLAGDIGIDVEQIVWQGRTVDVVRGEVIVRYEGNGLQGGQAAFDVAQPAMLTGQDRVNQLDGVTRAFADVDHEGLQVERHLGSSGLFLASGTDTLGLIDDLKATPGVTFVEPNFVVTKSSTPNDPSFDQLWGLHQSSDMDIDALEAWGISTGSPDVITAVVDTGIDYDHPDLAANMWVKPGEIAGDGIDNDNNGYVDDIYGIDTAYGDSDPYDGDSHGTHVAGTIAATGNNGVGVVGVAYGTKVMALKFLNDSGSGDTADAVEAINYITDMRLRGVNVVASNNSWGGGGYSQTLYDAIEAHNDAGLLFVAAAGNGTPFFGTPINNDADPQYPASYDLPGIISVANHQSSGAAGSSSNYGATSVDLAAPGTNVLSSVPGGGYSSFTGTSMASPHVAGVVALVNSVAPGLPIADVKAAILDSADPIAAFATTGSKPILTGGRLNAFKAIEPLGSPGLYGTVFDDIDGDGVRSGNEPALSGRTVYIDLDNDSVIDANEPQTLTALDGRFGFESLATGTYTVKLAEEAGRRQTLPASVIAYAAEGYDSSSTFASTTSTLVNGRVFNDVNGNGLFDEGQDTPLSGERIYLDADGDNDPGIGVIDESATVNSPITDYNTTLGTVAVTQTGVIDTLSVTVNLSHTYTGDLDIYLIAPDGTEVQLFDQHGSSGNDLVSTVFSDAASADIDSGSAPFTGTFRPVEPLAGFAGGDVQGTWTLSVYDNYGVDTGMLESFGITANSGDKRLSVGSDGSFAMTIIEGDTHRFRQILDDEHVATSGGYDVTGGGGTIVSDLWFGSRPTPTDLQVTAASFDYDATPAALFTFDSDVSASLTVDDLSVENLTTGQTMASSDFELAWDASSLTATFAATSAMADGDYRFTLASTVSDGAVSLGTDFVLEDFLLAGDINHDRVVNLADFGVLRANFGNAGLFAEGDLNGDGTVDLADFGVLRATFGNTLDITSKSLFA